MTDHKDGINRDELRRMARQAALMGKAPDVSGLDDEAVRQLLYEFGVYQSELLAQNEELRALRNELEAARDRYALLYDRAPVGYATLAEDYGVEKVNLTLCDMFGAHGEEVRKMGLFGVLQGPDRRVLHDGLVKARDSKLPVTLEVAVRREVDGDLTHLRLEIRCEEFTDGQGCHFLVAALDISERVRARHEVEAFQKDLESLIQERTQELMNLNLSLDRQSRKHWKILSSLPTGVILKAEDGRVLEANQAATNMLLTDRATLMEHWRSLPKLRFITPEGEDMAPDQYPGGRALRGEHTGKVRLGILHEDRDEPTWVEAEGVPMEDEGYGALIVFTDVSLQVKYERKLRKSHKTLRILSRHAEQKREEENKRIAREIHDQLGQDLTAMEFGLSWLRSGKIEGKESRIEKLDELLHLVRSSSHTVRTITMNLRPSTLDDLGLPETLGWLCKDFTRRSGMECRVDADPDLAELDPETADNLFRIAQEGLNNVLRHSQATEVHIELKAQGPTVSLLVEDNGKGMTNNATGEKKPYSYGLLGIDERVQHLGGSMHLDTAPGEGTRLTVSVPHTSQEGD